MRNVFFLVFIEKLLVIMNIETSKKAVTEIKKCFQIHQLESTFLFKLLLFELKLIK